MASRPAQKRLLKEYAAIKQQPPPFIVAKPLEKNILEWHYVITGPPDSPYYQGEYHGKLVFPADYPFKPPSIQMFTPSGRFQTNTRLCLTMSDFHPETWNPAWSVASILTGLLSFMMENTGTTGSVETTVFEKKSLAKRSRSWNRNKSQNPRFAEVFPELAIEPAELPEPVSGSSFKGSQSNQSDHHPSTIPTTATSNAEKAENQHVKAARRLRETANLLESDVIKEDIQSLIPSSRPIRFALAVTILSYLIYRWWQ